LQGELHLVLCLCIASLLSLVCAEHFQCQLEHGSDR
jgi:hypothetical protein